MYQEAAKKIWLIFFGFYPLKKALFFGRGGWLARFPELRACLGNMAMHVAPSGDQN